MIYRKYCNYCASGSIKLTIIWPQGSWKITFIAWLPKNKFVSRNEKINLVISGLIDLGCTACKVKIQRLEYSFRSSLSCKYPWNEGCWLATAQSFPSRMSSVNVTKSTVSWGFGHIYWINLSCKTSLFVQCDN